MNSMFCGTIVMSLSLSGSRVQLNEFLLGQKLNPTSLSPKIYSFSHQLQISGIYHLRDMDQIYIYLNDFCDYFSN